MSTKHNQNTILVMLKYGTLEYACDVYMDWMAGINEELDMSDDILSVVVPYYEKHYDGFMRITPYGRL